MAGIITAAAAIAAFLTTRNENRVLKVKLRLALMDCRAFYEIESRLCGRLASFGSTPLAVKRQFRESIRRDGMQTPSDKATPQKIAEELACL
jgi:hypothetical protein